MDWDAAIRDGFEYNPLTGEIWRKKVHRSIKHGCKVESIGPTGYARVSVKGKQYFAHRIAWFLYYGEWPQRMIDHVDGNKLNNKMDNLRLATHAENGRNAHKKTDSKSPYKGVTQCKKSKKWVAQIKLAEGRKRLGRFETPEEAHLAYAAAAKAHFGEFARLG